METHGREASPVVRVQCAVPLQHDTFPPISNLYVDSNIVT